MGGLALFLIRMVVESCRRGSGQAVNNISECKRHKKMSFIEAEAQRRDAIGILEARCTLQRAERFF